MIRLGRNRYNSKRTSLYRQRQRCSEAYPIERQSTSSPPEPQRWKKSFPQSNALA